MSLEWSREDLRERLRVLRDDPAGVRHTDIEYNECINAALGMCPAELLPRVVDETLTSDSESCVYELDFITERPRPESVQRVWIEDADEAYTELGRWWVLEHGSLWLMLDEFPAHERTIRVEYLSHWAALDQDEDETRCDTGWLLAQAMILLLNRDRSLEPTDRATMLLAWNAELERARRQAIQRPRRKVRTQAW